MQAQLLAWARPAHRAVQFEQSGEEKAPRQHTLAPPMPHAHLPHASVWVSTPSQRPTDNDTKAYEHLVVLMHGVMGRSSHMKALGQEIQEELGSRALVFSTSSYARLHSLRGTRFAGNAVFQEISDLVCLHKTSLKYISLVGYSFGGIVACWATALLYEHSFFGLQPLNFITIVCPHLGIRMCACVRRRMRTAC
jgi:predicted alpha/beta-fold hydrolase